MSGKCRIKNNRVIQLFSSFNVGSFFYLYLTVPLPFFNFFSICLSPYAMHGCSAYPGGAMKNTFSVEALEMLSETLRGSRQTLRTTSEASKGSQIPLGGFRWVQQASLFAISVVQPFFTFYFLPLKSYLLPTVLSLITTPGALKIILLKYYQNTLLLSATPSFICFQFVIL